MSKEVVAIAASSLRLFVAHFCDPVSVLTMESVMSGIKSSLAADWRLLGCGCDIGVTVNV